MDTIVEEREAGRARRRAGAKGHARPVNRRRTQAVRIADREHEVLSVHALKLGVNNAELVEELIRAHLKRFVVQDRGGPSPADVAAIAPDRATDTVEDVPIGETLTPAADPRGDSPAGAGEGGGAGPAPRRRGRG